MNKINAHELARIFVLSKSVHNIFCKKYGELKSNFSLQKVEGKLRQAESEKYNAESDLNIQISQASNYRQKAQVEGTFIQSKFLNPIRHRFKSALFDN